jgi:cobalt/nickel transport system permease protein
LREGHNSRINRAPAGLKLAGVLLFIVSVALLPRSPDSLYFFPAALLLVLWAVCRMPVIYALRRLVPAEFFILSIGALSLLRPDNANLFLSALIKSNLCIFAMILLTFTTSFQNILEALRRVRFPALMLTTLALMYRYLPVLGEESRRMQRARASRTFGQSRRLQWKSLTAILGQLFIRSAERAERIYLAMCARGWK